MLSFANDANDPKAPYRLDYSRSAEQIYTSQVCIWLVCKDTPLFGETETGVQYMRQMDTGSRVCTKCSRVLGQLTLRFEQWKRRCFMNVEEQTLRNPLKVTLFATWSIAYLLIACYSRSTLVKSKTPHCLELIRKQL